jgi:hypothetical protein
MGMVALELHNTILGMEHGSDTVHLTLLSLISATRRLQREGCTFESGSRQTRSFHAPVGILIILDSSRTQACDDWHETVPYATTRSAAIAEFISAGKGIHIVFYAALYRCTNALYHGISFFSTNRCPAWRARREEPPARPLRMSPTGRVSGDFSIWLHVEPPDPASRWTCSHRLLVQNYGGTALGIQDTPAKS